MKGTYTLLSWKRNEKLGCPKIPPQRPESFREHSVQTRHLYLSIHEYDASVVFDAEPILSYRRQQVWSCFGGHSQSELTQH